MEKTPPLVSIVIPCRNEAGFIDAALEALYAQYYPPERIEILVVDGMSDDGTREKLDAHARGRANVRRIDNPGRTTPRARNLGVRNAAGEVICLTNAHCLVEPDFIRLSVETLARTGADAAGGLMRTRNLQGDPVARAIPLAADSPFGCGGDRYRSRDRAGFVSDTLPWCAYRRDVFTRFGLFDEELLRDQDEELNFRILNGGGRIYYDPRIRSVLFIRPTLRTLCRQHFQYGEYKPLVAMKAGFRHTLVQTVPALFVTSLALLGALAPLSRRARRLLLSILSLYGALALLFARRALRTAGPEPEARVPEADRGKVLALIPLCFAALHVSYGLGYLRGLYTFILRGAHRDAGRDESLTR